MKKLLIQFTALFFLLMLLLFPTNIMCQIKTERMIEFVTSVNSNLINNKSGNGSSDTYHVFVLFDPSGFITFGPSVLTEPSLTKNLSVTAGIRFQNLGILQTSVYGKMDMSYMMHFSVRYYVQPKQKNDGFFIGPGLEYGRSNYQSGNQYNARAYGGELGYKKIYKNGFCFEIADLIGVVQSKQIKDGQGFPVTSEWVTDLFVFYMFSFKLGLAF